MYSFVHERFFWERRTDAGDRSDAVGLISLFSSTGYSNSANLCSVNQIKQKVEEASAVLVASTPVEVDGKEDEAQGTAENWLDHAKLRPYHGQGGLLVRLPDGRTLADP